MKEILVDVENFKEMIDGNYYYIDKTHMIESVLREKSRLIYSTTSFWKNIEPEYVEILL